MAGGPSSQDRLDWVVAVVRRTIAAWWLIAALTVIGSSIGLVYAVARPRVYRSETLMLYREGIRASDLGGGDVGGDPARKLGMKLKEIVLSRTSLQAIIEEFHLYPQLVADRGYVDAVDEMRNHIAFRIRDGDTFGLSFEGERPPQVQEVTAKLAAALVDENSRNRVEQATVTKQFLDTERQKSDEELKDKEGDLVRFLAEHPEFAREGAAGGAAIRERQRKNAAGRPGADPTLLALERQAERLNERLGAPPAERPKPAGPDPRLVAARNQADAEVQAAQRDLDNKVAQFTERHPDVLSAKTRLVSAEAKLRRADDALAAGIADPPLAPAPPVGASDRAVLQAALAKLNGEIAAYRSKHPGKPEVQPSEDASRIVALETEWTRRSREVAEAREREKQVEEKQFRAAMAANSVSAGSNPQMVILDGAYLPTHPARGGRTVIVLIGFFASFALGLGVALSRTLLDDRIFARIDLERLGVADVVCVVPRPGEPSWWRRMLARGRSQSG